MLTVLAIAAVLGAALVVLVRIALAGRRPPGPNDRERQHRVPGAHSDPPPPGGGPGS